MVWKTSLPAVSKMISAPPFVIVSTLLTYVSAQEVSNGPRLQVCYSNLGCFANEFPFNNTMELPQTPDFINTTFWVYTRRNPTTPQLLLTDQRSLLQRSSFDPKKKVKIIIHGFLQSANSPWVRKLVQEILRKEAVNMLTVDWGSGAGFPYTQSAANIRVVGAELTRFLRYLRQALMVSPRHVHIIGHSLGAQVAAYVGRSLPGLGRITGLDPAKPNFVDLHPLARLDSSDARFVDVIHTDGSPYSATGGYGIPYPLGHVDFYPNGGQHQPGCWSNSWLDMARHAYNYGLQTTAYSVSCSHDRSTALFIESINSPCPFVAFPCSSSEDFLNGNCLECKGKPCPVMGYSADQSQARGSYYLLTTGEESFCGYHYFLLLQLGPSMISTSGVLSAELFGSKNSTGMRDVYTGIFRASGTVKSLLFVRDDVGEVQKVHIRYLGDSRLFSWRADKLQVARVLVGASSREQTRIFCDGSKDINSGEEANFMLPAANLQDCS